MADGRREAGPTPFPVRPAGGERGTPKQPSWRPRQETGRMGGLLVLRTRGVAHYVELGKRSGAARRAKKQPVGPRYRVECRLSPLELELLQKITRGQGVTQQALVRSCILAGLAALDMEK